MGRPAGSKNKPKAEAVAPAVAEQAVNSKAPLDYLLGVMNDPLADPRLRVRAGIAAAQYLHTRTHDGGKKDERKKAAAKAGEGKFAPAAPPKLVVNNR